MKRSLVVCALLLLLMLGKSSWGDYQATPGTGITFGAVTDSGGKQYPAVGLVDGTAAANRMAVKAGSTAPVASDPAAVVTISPNSAIGATGQQTMANSVPVVLPSNQSQIPVNVAQVGGASISQGQQAKASSVPVTIASDQPATQFQFSPGTNGFTKTPFQVLTTELNTLTNGTFVVSSVGGGGANGIFSQTDTGNSVFGQCWFKSGGSFTPTGTPSLSVWYIRSTDGGTTFELNSAVPPRAPDLVIPLAAAAYASGNIVMALPRSYLWAESTKIGLQNNSGVSLPASGNQVTCGPEAIQH